MVCIDEGALMCDFAETYGLFDYRSLPIDTVATLAVGLRDDSRIKTKMRGADVPDASFLLAMIVDRVTDVLTFLGAYEGNTRPKSAIKLYLGDIDIKEKGAIEKFDTKESFEAARMKFLR